MLQCHYPVPVVVLLQICKIPPYSCNRLLIRSKTLISEEEFEFWEEMQVLASLQEPLRQSRNRYDTCEYRMTF